jgi:outer membrane lipoprotein carrier protein
VRAEDLIITRLQVTDRDGSEITISLDDVDLTPTFQASDFRFTPPEGVEIVDLRSSSAARAHRHPLLVSPHTTFPRR